MLEREASPDLIYLVAVEKGFSKEIGFTMLENMRNRFRSMVKSEEISSAKAFQFNPEFKSELKALYVQYSTNNMDKTDIAVLKMNDMINVQTHNMAALMERDDKVDKLLEKADQMGDESLSIRSNATQVRRRICWESIQVKLFMIIVTIILLYIIIAFLGCDFDFSGCF